MLFQHNCFKSVESLFLLFDFTVFCTNTMLYVQGKCIGYTLSALIEIQLTRNQLSYFIRVGVAGATAGVRVIEMFKCYYRHQTAKDFSHTLQFDVLHSIKCNGG